MDFLKAVLLGGARCASGHILIDKTNMTPARSLTGYVVAGVVLGAVGLYPKLLDWGGAGAAGPLTGVGNLLAKGGRAAVDKRGWLGSLTGGLEAAAGGVTAAVFFGLLAARCFRPGDMR